MTTQKMYSYIGYNGSVTTHILLPLDHIELIKITANDGHILTDGINKTRSIIVAPERVSDWKEEEFWGTIE